MSDVLLKIRAAKLQEDDSSPVRGPVLMEQALAALHAQGPLSLEIGNHGTTVDFFARGPERAASVTEGQIYAQYPDIDVERLGAQTLEPSENEIASSVFLTLTSPEIFPIKRHPQFEDALNRLTVDPLASITSTLANMPDLGLRGHIAISFRPMGNRFRKRGLKFLPLLNQGCAKRWIWYRMLFARVHLARGWKRLLLLPLDILMGGFRSTFSVGMADLALPTAPDVSAREKTERTIRPASRSHDREDDLQAAADKLNHLLFESQIRIRVISTPDGKRAAQEKIREIVGSFRQFALPHSNAFRQSLRPRRFVLSSEEIATIWHLPTKLVKTTNIDWVNYRKLEPPSELPTEHGLTVLGRTDARGKSVRFGIREDDRRRHVYIIGKTGMGKSTLLENMIASDIQTGKGLAVVDPHGDLADAALRMVPKSRTNDVILFDPADRDHPISFNMLECRSDDQRALICSSLMAVFQKLWPPEVWSGRMEHILRNTLLALIESRGNTLLGVMRMYADESYRQKVVSHISDPMVRSFWEDEFASWSEKYRTEAVAAIQNKIGQLLSTPLIRNIIGQVRSSINIRHAMDTGKIIIANVSKGRLGEDASDFLGSILVSKFQIDAMSRSDVPEGNRKDFSLYVDEFQNFATSSFATILSEARKYRLNLTMANQYIGQLTPDRNQTQLKDAVFGNVGTLLTFQVGFDDAEEIAGQFGDEALTNDILGLPKYRAYIRLMIDGLTSKPFTVATLPPPEEEQDEERIGKIRRLSRERYATKRSRIEGKIRKWAESSRIAKEAEKNMLKSKEKEEEERKKAKKKGMSLKEYRTWRDREMWTNRLNQLLKKEGTQEGLAEEEKKEMEDVRKKLGEPSRLPYE